MRLEVTQIAANEYVLEELVKKDIPEKYFWNDKGELLFAGTILDSERTVYKLVQFLFQNKATAIEIYRDDHATVLDFTPFRNQLIDFDYLDSFYQTWIAETGRETTMDEYGMLREFIWHARQTTNKKYLLMVVKPPTPPTPPTPP
jgi:hypothetical protein